MDEREPTDVDFEVISGPDAPPPPPTSRWSFLDNDLPVIVGIIITVIGGAILFRLVAAWQPHWWGH